MALPCRYADFAGSTINDGFDYTHGRDLWKEKLDYTNSWLSAHISDADAIGKPLIVEEFGKAVSAKKVYTGELPHSLQPGAHPFSLIISRPCATANGSMLSRLRRALLLLSRCLYPSREGWVLPDALLAQPCNPAYTFLSGWRGSDV